MATVTTKEFFPHAGALWSRVIDLFVVYLTTPGVVFDWAVGEEDGYWRVQIDLTEGSDTARRKLFDINHPSSEPYNFNYFFTLPGVFKSPGVLPKLRGSDAVKDLWSDDMVGMREAFVESLTGAEVSLLAGEDFTTAVPPTTIRTLVWITNRALNVGVDQASVATMGDGADEGYLGTQPDFQGGLNAPAITVVSGGATQSEVREVINSLNDIALIDVDYQANNGSVVFSMRGKVNAG